MEFDDDPDDAPRSSVLPTLLALLAVGAIVVAVVSWPRGPRRPAPPKAVPVAGTVTLDGQPLPDGDVAFDGVDGRPPVHAAVIDGHFTLAIAPGEKRVSVTRFQASTERNYLGEPVQASVIPDRYNVDTELRAVVTPSGPNHVDLQLRSR